MKRTLTLMATMFGLAGTVADPAATQAARAAPPSWLAYAAASTGTVAAWLNAGDPRATHLRETIDRTRPQPDRPTPPLEVKLWVDARGLVRRIEVAPPVDENGAEQIRGLLVGRSLGVPPRRMRQPMRLALGLPAAPPPPRSDI